MTHPMNREEVYRDIEQTLGMVPTFFKQIPDWVLEHEWKTWKNLELSETTIPGKYKELIGLAVAAQMQCQYCVFFHSEAARFYGATEEEIQETCHMAKLTTGWSTYLTGMRVDFEQFKHEFEQIREYMGRQQRRGR